MATHISDFLLVLTAEHSCKLVLKPIFEYIFDVCVLENVADPFSTVGKELFLIYLYLYGVHCVKLK